MKHVIKFKDFNNKPVSVVKEGLWSRLFGGDKDAATNAPREEDTEKDERNYMMFQGKKYYDCDIEYDDYNSTKQIPRVESGKLIIGNPAWSN